MTPHPLSAGGCPEPVMLLVLGPHRSGTSLVARLLECLGGVNSRTLLPPAEDNPTGFFEDGDIFHFNHHFLLPALGIDWAALGPPRWDLLEREVIRRLRAQAVAIVRGNYTPARPLSILKDPRMGPFLPFWLEVVREAGFRPAAVCCVRHPSAVARSLAQREEFSLAHGGMLYLANWCATFAGLSGLSQAFVSFEDVLARPEQCLRTISAQLAWTLPHDFHARVDEFVTGHLDHSLAHHAADAKGEMAAIPRAAQALHAALQHAAETQDPQPAAALATDQSRWLAATSPMLSEFDRMRLELDRVENAHRELASAHHKLERRLVDLQALAEEERRQLGATTVRLAAMESSTSWKLTAPMRWLGRLTRSRTSAD